MASVEDIEKVVIQNMNFNSSLNKVNKLVGILQTNF